MHKLDLVITSVYATRGTFFYNWKKKRLTEKFTVMCAYYTAYMSALPFGILCRFFFFQLGQSSVDDPNFSMQEFWKSVTCKWYAKYREGQESEENDPSSSTSKSDVKYVTDLLITTNHTDHQRDNCRSQLSMQFTPSAYMLTKYLHKTQGFHISCSSLH